MEEINMLEHRLVFWQYPDETTEFIIITESDKCPE
jgi:hypothetical protein